ncbi:hypothetical protein [Candidatus Mycolicibacterium alkanivorans]|uniref:Uncharacterized protein n=1 Tax=Candidatus Mycolicibacterium alkanivorans TaxID=2954114 RepID=A0ABS9YXA2_9MYCO|nr:hypothetical protein [Candidatus Mycolicibacterium alkanivorans]MCI4675728.1 hypothetical protein [Candidatus Mycolicibacterium alkanivorans]
MALTDEDMRWLGRCAELAREALDAGDGDATAHPELAIARLPVSAVAAHLVADGPAPELREEMMALYAARFRP